MAKSLLLFESSLVLILSLFRLLRCQIILGDPCLGSANYDGTDIGKPYTVDNSTGTPIYTYINVEDYHPPSHAKRGATAYKYRLWPQGIVQFDLDHRYSTTEREKILDAMRHWEENTCIRFHPMSTAHMLSGVFFFKGSGCCSNVGRVSSRYIQTVCIGPSCSLASVIHEIGHVLGFWHEQNRPDRDKYITVHQQNIRPGYRLDFQKISSIDSLGVPYDFNSIMQYSETAFAKPGTITISTKESDIPIGKAPELSRLDIIQTELLYKDQCGTRSSSVSRLPVKVALPSPVKLSPGRCNKHFLGKTGQISPPDTPYKSNTTCNWVVEVPTGYYIQLDFYNIELDTPCSDDVGNYVKVYASHNEVGQPHKFCRSVSHSQLYITGIYAYIKLHTNSVVNTKGLRGFSKVKFTARDINECASNYCDHSCTNLDGSYKCSCRKGYYLAGTRRCFDINECSYSNGNCSHMCVNMAGTYRCECPSGYTLLSNKLHCLKGELPCQLDNGGCKQICTDTLNGPVCSCRKGYVLFSGVYCADINECRSNKGICGTNKICYNIRGGYLCLCKVGYRQSENGSCEDVNECSNRNLCGLKQHCVNTPGSYRCECDTGYQKIKEECVDIDECSTGVHDCEPNEDCINKNGTYNCQSAKGHQLFNGSCEDINGCNGGCDHTCVNTNGSCQCSCNPSYVLAADNRTCISSCNNYTIVQEPTGNISTTSFPDLPYASGSNCTWIIDLPVEYNSIELKFNGMLIEESPNCVKDHLTVVNGKDEDSLSMATYCGTRSPNTMHSSTGSVTIKFVSDSAVNSKGFNLQYKGLTERAEGMHGCDVKLYENTTFALANFPLKYTDPVHCTYSLIAPKGGYKVKLTFLYLDIQAADCSMDRIEVYNGKKLTPNKKLADVCNSTHTTEFMSKGRHMRMKYIGTTLRKYRGFHASVLFV